VRSPAPLPLWRFVLVAAILVVAAGSVLFARRAGPPDLKIAGRVSGTPTPTAQRPDAESTPASAAFLGSGSWAMSSLPSCFRERERISGTVAQLRSQFPPASERVRPPGVVSAGDCIVVVGEHDLMITRGADRLRVPPQADLYRNRAGLTLVYVQGKHAEIRRY
jgi:hypothetical protein